MVISRAPRVSAPRSYLRACTSSRSSRAFLISAPHKLMRRAACRRRLLSRHHKPACRLPPPPPSRRGSAAALARPAHTHTARHLRSRTFGRTSALPHGVVIAASTERAPSGSVRARLPRRAAARCMSTHAAAARRRHERRAARAALALYAARMSRAPALTPMLPPYTSCHARTRCRALDRAARFFLPHTTFSFFLPPFYLHLPRSSTCRRAATTFLRSATCRSRTHARRAPAPHAPLHLLLACHTMLLLPCCTRRA